jgi:acyl dehydratase
MKNQTASGPEALKYEDFIVGERVLLEGAYDLTAKEIVAFAEEFDPHPFHLDEEAAEASMLGTFAASGWHACAIVMRLMYDGYLNRADGHGSPGLKEVRWLKPVRPGQRLRLARTCLNARPLASRPHLGICHFKWELIGEDGEVLLMMDGHQIFGRRDARPAAEA